MKWCDRTKRSIKYSTESDDFLTPYNLTGLRGELITPTRRVTTYRDLKDYKLLEVALATQGDRNVSTYVDLLGIPPFEAIHLVRDDHNGTILF